MNKRMEARERTREAIVDAGKACFTRSGFLNTTTGEVAKRAGIAHGTLFFHFKTKEALVLEVMDREFASIALSLHDLLHHSGSLKALLEAYLDFLQEREDFFSVIYRELPFYSGELKRRIIFRESAIRGHFYSALAGGISRGVLKDVDITMVLTFLFAGIHSLAASKEMFTGGGSIIKEKKESIVKTFLAMVSK